MKEIFDVLLSSRNCSDTATILKMYNVRFRGDYIRIIDYFVSELREANKENNILKHRLQAKPISVTIQNPVNLKIIDSEEIEII